MNNNLKMLEFYKDNNFLDKKYKYDEWLYYLLTENNDVGKLIDEYDNLINNDIIPNFIWKKYYYDLEFNYEFNKDDLNHSIFIYKLIQELCEINMYKNLDFLKSISHEEFIKNIEDHIIGIDNKNRIMNELLSDEGDDESILISCQK